MRAKCLCEKVEFEFEPVDGVAMNCYCSICRRSHGAGYATQLMSTKSTLKFVKGESYLTEYASSKYGIRAFCSCCGSRLMNYAKVGSDYMSVSLAAVADEHDIKPCSNVHIASKPAWVTPDACEFNYDELPDDMHKYM